MVFPGQGTVGGRPPAPRDAVRDYVGDEAVPYQLSVFAGSVDLLYRLREAGIVPDVVAGHSLGEYAAAHGGEPRSHRWCAARGERDRLMGEASGRTLGMVALIGAEPDDIAKAAEEAGGIVVAANFNTRQTVVSGQMDALGEVAERVRGRKVKLEVSGLSIRRSWQGLRGRWMRFSEK